MWGIYIYICTYIYIYIYIYIVAKAGLRANPELIHKIPKLFRDPAIATGVFWGP